MYFEVFNRDECNNVKCGDGVCGRCVKVIEWEREENCKIKKREKKIKNQIFAFSSSFTSHIHHVLVLHIEKSKVLTIQLPVAYLGTTCSFPGNSPLLYNF